MMFAEIQNRSIQKLAGIKTTARYEFKMGFQASDKSETVYAFIHNFLLKIENQIVQIIFCICHSL